MLEPKGADPLGSSPAGLFEDLLDFGSYSAPVSVAAATSRGGTFMGVLKHTTGYRKLAWGEEEDEVIIQ